MIVVHKHALVIARTQNLAMRRGAKVIHVGLDPQGQPHLWAQVDDDALYETRRVFIIGTGQFIPPAATDYVSSFMVGPYMWHVFMEPRA